ncbi:MAG: HAD family hydrolase [Pseudomonadota bacterium]|nr:HAD family hydrolase [Pseudomonadota bacterium]
MTLVVFDMDGTLLDAQSKISPFTSETLSLMRQNGIAYTVATGRTLQAALSPLADDNFDRSLVLKNGAVIWEPTLQSYSHHHLLTPTEVSDVLSAFIAQDLTPFVFSLEDGDHHAVYHAPLRDDFEKKLANLFESERELPLQPLTTMPINATVINVSAMGPLEQIEPVIEFVSHRPHLVAYSGVAIRDKGLAWLDVHHSQGSKANGVKLVADRGGFEEVVAFGDGDNDISLFEFATESYAMDNAEEELKGIATKVIGHHDEDGVARFLRDRFNL